jgi:hypothetical protein
MAPPGCGAYRADNLRDAIVARHLGLISVRNAPAKYKVPSRAVYNALEELDGINAERIAAKQASLIESSERRQVFRWASKFTGAPIRDGYTHWELREAFIQNATTGITKKSLSQEFGIPETGMRRFQKKALAILKIKSMKLLKEQKERKQITMAKIRSAANSIQQQRRGQKPYLTADEEALVIATAEIKGSHAQPVQRKTIAAQLNTILESMPDNPRTRIAGGAKRKSQLNYAREVIRRVNAREPEMEGQTKKSLTGEIRVAGLSNSRAKQSDPRLAWVMFHSICKMFREGKERMDCYLARSLLGIRARIQETYLGPKMLRPTAVPDPAIVTPGPVKKKRKVDWTAIDAAKSLEELRIVPSDLKEIQPRADQNWSVDEIGIDPNGKWSRIVCTYKWCVAEKIWKTQRGERAPFWCTILFFTRGDGQCPIPPTVVHQGTDVTADFFLNLPNNWVCHATPSGYMDRDGWFKTVTNFVHLSGASESNPQYVFFDGHDSHWDSDALEYMVENNANPFFLKAGDSEKDQPNDNGPNCSIKGCYNDAKAEYDEKWVTVMQYAPAQMNMVLTQMWRRFLIKAAPVIISAFSKTKICPLLPPSDDQQYAAHACTASLQCASGKKAVELELMRQEVMAPVQVKMTRTSEECVILRAKCETSRNLVIRSVCFDIVNRTMVVPVQELKAVLQEQTKAKETKLGSLSVDTQSRENPDTSRGLYVTAAILRQAKLVQEAKQQKKEHDEAKKEINNAKKTGLAINRAEALFRLTATILKSDSLMDGLKNHNPAGDLKLVYQHLGGKVSILPDGKRETFVKLLLVEEDIISIRSILQANNNENCEPMPKEDTLIEATTDANSSINDNNKLTFI